MATAQLPTMIVMMEAKSGEGLAREARLPQLLRVPASSTARSAGVVVWFCALSLVVVGPLWRPGFLLLLDWPTGPNPNGPPLFPLPSQGLVSAATPLATAVRTAEQIAPGVFNKLLIAAIILLGASGLYRFATVHLHLRATSSLVAGTFFVINPFVYERLLAGQLNLALGYALLPYTLPSLLRVSTSTTPADVFPALGWVTLVSLVSLHIGGMALLLLAMGLLFSARRVGTRLALVAVSTASLAAIHLFWVLPSALSGEAARLGTGDLLAYAPRPRSVAVLSRVLLLHGFWRTEFPTPLSYRPALFLLTFGALLAMAGVGVVAAFHRKQWRRPAAALGVSCLTSIVLAMGTSFPATAPVIRLLFERLPGFGVYREPQKWVAVLALGYALFLAAGLDVVLARRRSSTTRYGMITAALLPLLATPLMLWGFSGLAQVSRFPDDWQRAAGMTEGGPGKLLFLPWHHYQPLPFAGDRVVANPAPDFFASEVLVSERAGLARRDVTLPNDPRDLYVTRLLARRRALNRFGRLVSPLGVRYVALARLADARRYRFLDHQADLSKVFEGPDLVLYENEAWRGDVYRVPRARQGVSSGGDGLGGPAIIRLLPTWREVEVPPGSGLGTSLSCRDGWRLGDAPPPRCYVGAVALFESPAGSRELWRPGLGTQLAGYLASAGALMLLVVAIRGGRHRRPRRSTSPVLRSTASRPY